MTLRKRLLPAFFTAGLIAVSISGCNVFDFAVDANKTPLEQAEESLRANDPDAAISALTDSSGAVIDSTNSMVLYTYAKALLLKSGLSVAEIIGLANTDKGAAEDSGTNAMLDVIDGKSFAEQTAWYQANLDLIKVLGKIRSGAATGDIDSSDVTLDYSIANIVSGMLSLRDTNCDKKIDSDDFQIKLTDVSKLISGGGDSGSGFAFDEIIQVSSTGDTTSFAGLTAFLSGFSLKHAKAARTSAYTYTPDDINKLLATFFGFLVTGEDTIVELINSQTDASLSPDEVKKYIREAAIYVNKYWYDDGIDNDGDGSADEETIDGIDNDGDGLVDEDSQYMSAYDTTDNYYDTDKPNSNYWPIFHKWDN